MSAFGVRCAVCVIVASSSPSFHTLILSFIHSFIAVVGVRSNSFRSVLNPYLFSYHPKNLTLR